MYLNRLFAMLILCGGVAAAEPASESTPPGPPEMTIHVITLAHASAEQVVMAIRELGFPIASVLAPENRIILRGPASEIQAVLKEIVSKIDVPSASAGSSTVDFIPLSRRPTDSFRNLLDAVIPSGPGTSFALDPASRLIAVNAPKERVAAIRRLVEAAERPAESYLVHFYFLKGTVGSSGSEEGSGALPKDLVPVAAALRSAGFNGLQLVAPLVLQAVDGADFRSTVDNPRGDGERTNGLGIFVRGKPSADSANSVVNLELEVKLTGLSVRKTDSGSMVSNPALLSAQSTVTVRLDSCVVLAAAPSSQGADDAYAVAVKVTRVSPAKP